MHTFASKTALVVHVLESILGVQCGFNMKYEGVSINNQPISFPIDRDGHDFHALFQYMF